MLTVWEIFIISQEGLIESEHPRWALDRIIDVAAATLCIRVFAMYGRNIRVLVPLLALVCISVTLAVVRRISDPTCIPVGLECAGGGAVKFDGPAKTLAAPGLNGCTPPYPRS